MLFEAFSISHSVSYTPLTILSCCMNIFICHYYLLFIITIYVHVTCFIFYVFVYLYFHQIVIHTWNIVAWYFILSLYMIFHNCLNYYFAFTSFANYLICTLCKLGILLLKTLFTFTNVSHIIVNISCVCCLLVAKSYKLSKIYKSQKF